jgi:RNA polymerase sigma-70 factor, ECF subfamily
MKISTNIRNEQVQRMYRKYARTIYARCRRLLSDPQEAEDAVHEVFMRVLRHLETAPSEEEALPWIYRISSNYCLNHLRNARTRLEKMSAAPERAPDAFEDQLMAKQLARRLVANAVREHQVPVVMYHLADVDQQTIAHRLGVTRRTVINRLNAFADDAREFLKKVDLGEG